MEDRHARGVWLVTRALKRRYHDYAHGNLRNPLNELLFIVCSVKTTEANYIRAYRDFRRAFPSSSAITQADRQDLAKSLRIGGLYRTKARFLKRALHLIVAAFGKPTLAPAQQYVGW